jgi:beta-mannosidase
MKKTIAVQSLFLALALPTLLHAAGSPAQSAAARAVGVLDERLISQENWVKPWKSAWASGRIVELFGARGIKATVIGLDTLTNSARLSSYPAIMIPTDECYPEQGRADGPLSKCLAAYVKAGGIYIMPMGASHCRWKDLLTGAVVEAPQWAPRDFLGIQWNIVGDHAGPGPSLSLTEAGEKIGLPPPRFSTAVSTYARAATPLGVVYVSNAANQPCLYANAIGNGAVIHYAGGLPLGPEVRDWLVGAYAAILKSGPDMKAIRLATMPNSSVYDLLPVCARAKGEELSLDGEWELAQAEGELSREVSDVQGLPWTRVRMPNTVQHALFEAGKIENPWYSDNYKKLQWIHQQDWYLRRHFSIPEDWRGRHIRLRFDGLDYLGLVWLDGSLLGSHEGMFGGPTFEVTPMLTPGNHELLVRLVHETTPQSGPTQVMKSMAVDGTSYQWGNRYRTIGLWRSVRLVGTGSACLEAPCVRTDRIRQGEAVLDASALVYNPEAPQAGTVVAKIVDLQTAQVVWQTNSPQAIPSGNSYWEQTISIENPKLWWPNGVADGTQPLYRLELSLLANGKETDSISTRFGIRTLEMVRNPSWPKAPRSKGSSWGEVGSQEWEVMMSPDESYRFLFVVNGLPMYAKGGCWLTSDDLLVLAPERESWLVRAARAGGLNLFRLNGGCNIFETEQFYNLCDENGILVWQELPFCWHATAGSKIPAWRDQLTQSVLRLRQHPSLAVYVGGNEFNPYHEGVVQVVDLFREICAGYDDRPFRMSSPGGGTFHAYGPWEMYSGDTSWYGTIYDEGYNFVSEWSFPSCGSLSLLNRIVPKAELAGKPIGLDFKAFTDTHPILTDRSSEFSFVGKFPFIKGSWYADYTTANLPEYVQCAQMAQADLYGTVFEQWRSQFPYKGGETVWLYNTIGPVSSWNLIDWFGQPQISYYSTKRADEPVHLMARMPFRSWGPGDTLRAPIMVLSDRQSIDSAHITARILDREMKPAALKEWLLNVRPGEKNIPPGGNEMTWQVPSDTPDSYFFLELTLAGPGGKRLSQQVYWQRVLNSLADAGARSQWQSGPVPEPICAKGPWLKPQIASHPTTLSFQLASIAAHGPEAGITATVRNTGPNPAYPVCLSINPDACAVVWSDNYFWLAPGDSATVTGTVRLDMRGLDPMGGTSVVKAKDLRAEVEAWNAPRKAVSAADYSW